MFSKTNSHALTIRRLQGLLAGCALLTAVGAEGAQSDAIRVSGTDANAFRLSWAAVDGALGYVVNVWSNGVVGASDGVEVLHEGFSLVPNMEYVKPWPIDDVNRLGDYHSWTGELVRGYPSRGADDRESAVVLGTEDATGWLMSSSLDVSGEAIVRLRMSRHTDDDSAPVLIAFVRDGATNFAETVILRTATHAFADYCVTASNLTSGCRLLVSSQRKLNGLRFGRVAVADISVRCGCSAGTEVAVPVVTDEFVEGCSYSCKGVNPALYGCSVVPLIGVARDEGRAVTAKVDMRDPAWLRCWRTSDFLPKPGCRVHDLSGMERVSSRREWRNGTDGDGIYAFDDALAAVDVRPYSELAAYHAIYQFNAGTERNPTNVLGMLGVGTSGLRLVLPLRLDAERPVRTLSASYVLRRLFREKASADTELSFSWTTGDDIDAMRDENGGWSAVEDGGFVASAGGKPYVERRVEISGRSLRTANYLFLRWSVPRQSNSEMIGLSDLCVAGSLCAKGFGISVR